MITCNFDKRGKAGLCEYLTDEIRRQIQTGILQPEEKLPSKRNLSAHLGISVITVANAYSELIDEGYIYSLEKRGFFVTSLLTKKQAENIPIFNYQNRQISSASNPAFSKDYCKKIQPNWFADFKSNSISYEKFPFSLWSHVMRKVLQQPHESLLQSAPAQGVWELRCAIASYLQTFRNMTVHPDNIVIGAGTEYLYGLVVQLLGRNRIYAVENPGYRKIQAVLSMNGTRCVPVQIDSLGMVPEKLDAVGASVVHISPSHHFPTGIVMPVRRRQELLAWASAQKANTLTCSDLADRWIIEDDYDSEFRFNGKPLATIQSVDNNKRVIYINTFSKSMSPSYRISYMVLPSNLSKRFNNLFASYTCTVSNFEQFALARFINDGFFEKHIVRMKNYYRTLRNNLISALENAPFSKNIEIREENAGLHFLLKLQTALSGVDLKQKFFEESLNIPLLSDFFYTESASSCFKQKTSTASSQKKELSGISDIFEKTDSTLVLNYSGIRKERIAEAVIRLGKAAMLNYE